MKSYILKPGQTQHNWIIIDANNTIPGRLAAFISHRLQGKHRTDYTPHVDNGDHVIVINAEKISFTGRKLQQKTWYRHSGYPGGIKASTAKEMLAKPFPERIIKLAVKRMLPKESAKARKQFAKLHVYAGNEHPHQAQQPTTINFASMNKKNVKAA